nr:hypothetical protein [Armatimonadota bacterium]NIM24142.1 hypothetical protein [Armatimonadota bacterium]NIM68001.1 hypothetical protein [Armatimonadota bacterium]NIN06224.1 hypothetical protein [Armatimonadota bacterium]NIO97711.1 hypothetical protein [Armatimonadota bacterium]
MERFPAVAARLYDYLFSRPPMHRMYAEIARDLASSIDRGRLLDVGTGPGRLLLQIHALNPEIEL